ncbi:hypothetical protein [Cupriavidus necator]|uniref:hypothetical protein n=1 Tax=Cupriavidus necator TaxID=106590 RepID=UPI00339D7E13
MADFVISLQDAVDTSKVVELQIGNYIKGDPGDKGDKGDTGDVTPDAIIAKNDAQAAASAAAASAAGASASAIAAATSAAEAANVVDNGIRPDLANTADPAKGAAMVGYGSSTVKSRLDDFSDASDPAKGSALLGFLHEHADSVGRTQRDKSNDTYSFRDAGCVGNGVADDTAAVLRALKSNRIVEGRPGDIYRVTAPTDVVDKQNLTIDLKGAEIRLDIAGTPTPGQAHILKFRSSSSFGQSKNITVYSSVPGGKLGFANAPTARADNNFPLSFDGVDGVYTAFVEVDKSWSAGIWTRRCNNVLHYKNYIHDTKADGSTAEGCGRNVAMLYNVARDTGDDGFAITWFTGNDPAYVGETDGIKRTKHVVFEGNQTYNSGKRGIFLGGAMGGSVCKNRVEASNAVGILFARDTVNPSSVFYSVNGVNNSNDDLDVFGNTLIGCAVGSNSPNSEVGGMWVTEYNTRIRVHHNYAKGCNNVSFYAGGNAEFTQNTSEDPVLVAGGSVPLSSMTYKGGHFATADFSSTNTCFGKIEDNTCIGGPFRVATINTGYGARSWSVRRNRAFDVGDLSGVSDGVSMISLIRVVSIANVTVRDNEVSETRAGNLVNYIVSVKDNAANYVADNRGISLASGLGTELLVDNASMSARSIIRVDSTQASFPLAAGAKTDFTVTVTGAAFGMRAAFGPPGDTQAANIDAIVTAANTVKVYIANNTAGAITVAAGTWKIIVGG